MVIDAKFWLEISFIIFIGGLIYLKVPKKIILLLDNSINIIKNEIEEAEKLKNETKKLLSDSQIKIDNAQKESQKIIENAKKP
jgi:F-type H+-transporting ATPase subunit b